MKRYTPEELQKKVKIYIDQVSDRFALNSPDAPTVGGLTRHLGLTRQGFKYYKELPGYEDIIELALVDISKLIEEGLLSGKFKTGAAIFYLKAAFQWRENIAVNNVN